MFTGTLNELIEQIKKKEPVLGDKSIRIIKECYGIMGNKQEIVKNTRLHGIVPIIASLAKNSGNKGKVYYMKLDLIKKLESMEYRRIRLIKDFSEIKTERFKFQFKIKMADDTMVLGKATDWYIFINMDGDILIVNEYDADDIERKLGYKNLSKAETLIYILGDESSNIVFVADKEDLNKVTFIISQDLMLAEKYIYVKL